ncbi:protein PRRC1-like [Plodia interpunctella]|uniref:protein PRRC1-like n=1 Tax=Plodia interpunctella TaxID=58824 RepID=UPI0023681B66|nr:protein PRRC1-like [Plodia interpunctella]XP_053614698.1 protein PRRC1-like [Plodia interpunctella]
MSGSDKKSKFPEAPTPAAIPGNLLSSVAPPTQLPNFVTTSDTNPNVPPAPVPIQPVLVQKSAEPRPQIEESFSPAIPLSKGEPLISIRSPEDSQTTQSPESLPASTPDVDQIGDIMPGSGLFTWVKGAVSTGGILHRVAEKAKSSVDSMITTLDPQMKEYLRSGGDLYIVVASDKDVKVSPIREAFQTVFGKATVVGVPAQSNVTAEQPIGYAAAYAAAKQRIAHIRSNSELTNNVPVVAVEGFLHEAVSDKWNDLSLLVLSQPSLGIELQVQSQGAGVPTAAVAAARAGTPEDYQHHQTGFSVTIGSIMAASLQVPHTQWQEAATGVSRRETILLAAKSLAGSYKRLLAVSAAET